MRAAILALLTALGGLVAAAVTYYRSSYYTRTSFAPEQPVPFSHAHHVGMVGLDCRFCHQSADERAFAGIPPTQTCMTCHSQLFTTAPVLEPVRESWRTGTPLVWQRVHDLPDHVYFNHSIHIDNGVACISCHGRVDRMPLVRKAGAMTMKWCLDCHENPAPLLSPPGFTYATQPASDSVMSLVMTLPTRPPPAARYAADKAGSPSPQNVLDDSVDLMQYYDIDTRALMDCTTCHR